MTTVGRKIDVKSGLLTMTVQDINIEFQMFEALKKNHWELINVLVLTLEWTNERVRCATLLEF